jgi:hypothetical protein
MNERLKELYAQKHKETPNYGMSAKSHIDFAKKLIERKKCKTFIDYGCGKAVLSQNIPGMVNYDFAIPEYSQLPPGQFDVAFCIDVLEHIPESDLPETLRYLKHHADNVYFCIHLGESLHKLPNGEPCHCTVKPAWWWIAQLSQYWKHVELVAKGKLHLTVIAS